MTKTDQTSKRCYVCKAVKSLDDFYAASSRYDGKQSKCKACDNEHATQRIRERKKQIDAYLGQPVCSHCGFTHTSFDPFDLHHVDPTTKEYAISKMWGYSWAKIKAEIDKCILLCKNCHAIEHERIRNDCSL